MCGGFWPKQGDVRRFPVREGLSAKNSTRTSRASCQTRWRITAHRARRAIEQQRRRRPMRNRAPLGPASGRHRAGKRVAPGPAGGWRRAAASPTCHQTVPEVGGVAARRRAHRNRRSTVCGCASGLTRHQLGALPPRAQRAALIRFALIKLPAGSTRAGLWRAGSRGGLSCCRCSPACRAARTPGSRCLPASS